MIPQESQESDDLDFQDLGNVFIIQLFVSNFCFQLQAEDCVTPTVDFIAVRD